jgi:hypothetical protein
VPQERFGVVAIGGITRRSAFDGDGHRPVSDRERLIEYRGSALLRPVGRTPALVEYRHECATAEVGEIGAASEPARQALGDSLKEAIANMAAVCVVDIAQPLDVEDDNTRGGALCDQLVQTMLQMLTEEFLLRKKRQRVNGRKMTRSALGGE